MPRHAMRPSLSLLSLFAALAAACAGAPAASTERQATAAADTARLMSDVRVLAADSMEGRAVGTPGSERARRYLLSRFRAAGLRPFGADFQRPFTTTARGREVRGVNLVGYLPGVTETGLVIVVTAHYDHLGVQNGQVFNGADDNASGVAALLAIAEHFAANRPRHTLVFAALDAEEAGLLGARAFLADPPVDRARIALNVNMDMVSRNDRDELYAAGTHHTPALRPFLERAAAGAPITLRFGHDSPELPARDNWTQQSDHGVFHSAGIPFVYFGVEDHPDYHRPTDDVERIQPAFFAGAAAVMTRAVAELDAALEAIRRPTGR